MKKRIALLMAVVMIVAMFAACTPSAPTQPTQPTQPNQPTTPTTPGEEFPLVKLNLGHVQTVTHVYSAIYDDLFDDIRALTDGNLDIAHFPASQLGSEEEQAIANSQGTQDFWNGSCDTIGKRYAPMLAMHSPYAFKSVEHIQNFIASDLYANWIEEAATTSNMRVVNTMYYGARHLTASKKILVPEEMAGFKLRIPMAPAQMAFADAIGAVATPMAVSEVYLALQQRTVDGQENPVPTIIAQKFYEVQPYLMLTGHINASCPTTIANNVWLTLPENYQQIIAEQFKLAEDRSFVDIIAATEEGLEEVRSKGMDVVEVDMDAFNALGEVTIQFLAKEYGDEVLGAYADILSAE